jgi:hypothetical protein
MSFCNAVRVARECGWSYVIRVANGYEPTRFLGLYDAFVYVGSVSRK